MAVDGDGKTSVDSDKEAAVGGVGETIVDVDGEVVAVNDGEIAATMNWGLGRGFGGDEFQWLTVKKKSFKNTGIKII